LRKIHTAVIQGYYLYSEHADEQMLERAITRREVEAALLHGEPIEHYAERYHGEACLMLGRTEQGRVLHVACGVAYRVIVMTVYEPDPAEWEPDFKTRR
jgi:hypothetical protein